MGTNNSDFGDILGDGTWDYTRDGILATQGFAMMRISFYIVDHVEANRARAALGMDPSRGVVLRGTGGHRAAAKLCSVVAK